MKVSRNSIVCDSSSLISLADSCFLPVLADLRRYSGGDFLISEAVKYECVDHPLRMKSHTLTAIRLQLALNDGVIKAVDTVNLRQRTDDVLWVANNIFFSRDKPISIMHRGEAETFALAIELGLKNVLIDERTSRVLVEGPESLRAHLEKELGRKIRLNTKYLERFERMLGDISLFRSSEILIMAFERGHFKKFKELERKALEAALYGVKFNGCSISFEEIEEYMRSLE